MRAPLPSLPWRAVPGHIDDVIRPAHDPEIAIRIDIACIGCQVMAGIGRKIRLDKVLVILPEGGVKQPGGNGSLTTIFQVSPGGTGAPCAFKSPRTSYPGQASCMTRVSRAGVPDLRSLHQ